ncbi:MAG: hypothetical protein KAT91_04890 [Candidatus Aenigmarchaeota archaeon]|nr:hypothetical protein [Candidatus Aenigmarchaeota archaeon]
MIKKQVLGKYIVLLAVVFALVFGIFTGYILFSGKTVPSATTVPSFEQFDFGRIAYTGSGGAVMLLPAVMRNNTGVSAHVVVTAQQGTGKITANLNNVLVADDTQQSIRMAAFVAQEHEGIKSGTIDLNYDIYADASTLEGPSAGAAFTVVTIAAIRNATVSTDAMMTGTVNHDGAVGPAGKVIEKAGAAKDAGAVVFLVPVGASKEINYTESEFCHTWGTYNYCQPEFTPEVVDVSVETGITIIEVQTIDDALKYFLE